MKLLGSRSTARAFHLPLWRTVLCLDCDECFEIGTDRCPVCGSGAWASVARFLEGDMKFDGLRLMNPSRAAALHPLQSDD